MPDDTTWRIMASGLVTVRDAVHKVDQGCIRSVERAALAKVAGSPAFTGLGPDGPERGAWIVTRVRHCLLDLERGAARSPADRAIRCWARYVDEGLTPAQLHDRHPGLIVNDTPARTAVARRTRVQSLMWAGGARGDKDSLPGVLRLAAELRTVLSTGLPDGTRMDATTFGYEWDRLARTAPQGRDLLQVLARLAPDQPFPRSLLQEAGDCLPGLAQDACATPGALRETCTALHGRGLLVLDRSSVSVQAGIADHVIAQVTPRQSVHWTAAVLRFLTHAVRPDTHHSDSWAEWTQAYPHVLAVCESAETHDVQLGDVAYLLDRASVYQREGLENPGAATALAERAVTVARAAGDRELIGDSLGNLALAHRAANRMADAVQASTASVTHVGETCGTDHETYAESLTVHAGVLAAAGHTESAAQAHEQAVTMLRDLHAVRPDAHLRGLLIGALNDHAGHLLSTGGPATAGAAMLAEANRLVRRGEYGWTQITLNLARACRATGDLAGARRHLESVRDHCAGTGQQTSITNFCALADLAEVYDELGDRRAGPTLREAHRVDNALAATPDRPLRHGRSS